LSIISGQKDIIRALSLVTSSLPAAVVILGPIVLILAQLIVVVGRRHGLLDDLRQRDLLLQLTLLLLGRDDWHGRVRLIFLQNHVRRRDVTVVLGLLDESWILQIWVEHASFRRFQKTARWLTRAVRSIVL
jgi:hypothetical protein